jgi:DNA transformation protein and related proteins
MADALDSLKNIGPKTRAWLHEVDIHTPDDLDRLGAVEVYKRLKERFPEKVSLNALWALQAAILGIPWTALPPDMKDELRARME